MHSPPVVTNRRPPLFWAAQVLGWGGWATFQFLMVPGIYPLVSFRWGAMFWAAEGAMGLLWSTVLRAVYRRMVPEGGLAFRDVARAAAACGAAGIAWSVCSMLIWSASYRANPHAVGFTMPRGVHVSAKPVLYLVIATADATILAVWSTAYLGLRLRRAARADAERALRADASAQQARFQALRWQLNPHFLFNSLNSLQALIPEDPDRAARMVGELAEFLRYALAGRDDAGAPVPLRDEAEAIRAYLAVEKVRFEERLDVDFEVQPAAEAVPVPGFILQPLVENAVKHGMQTSPMPLRLRIAASLGGGALRLEVANTGRWGGDEGAGIGLRNVRERLALAYRGRASVDAGEADGWVRVAVTIPAEAGR
jgi:hypothetical protein